jgi:TolA-binding protein
VTGTERDEAELDAVLASAAADLSAEGAPRAGDEQLIRRAVEGAIARLVAGASPPIVRGARWQRVVLLAAAIAIMAGGAFAFVEHSRTNARARQGAFDGPAQVSSAAPPAARNTAAPVVQNAAALPSVEPPPSSAPEPVAIPAEPGAVELFSQANEARRRGDGATAVSRYAQLQRRFPHSPEATLSQVALGRLYLDRLHDPGRALAQFDGYLSAPGETELREEALVGRAIALQSLGRASEEREAWRTLLDAYPSSLSSDRAKERLRELH